MGKKSRAKGATGERELCRELEKWTGLDFYRTAHLQAARSNAAPDVDTEDHQWRCLWIECKRQKAPSIPAAIQQAMAEAGQERMPVAMTRADRGPWLVTMTLEDFAEWSEMLRVNGLR